MQNDAEIVYEAEAKAGEMLKVMVKHKGGRPRKTTDIMSGVSLEEIGVSLDPSTSATSASSQDAH